MSSLIAIQTNEQVIFASDTALSADYQKRTYRVSNVEQKLFEYDNFIMFASGKKELRDLLLNNIGLNPSIESIKNYLIEKILPISEEFSLEVVIAQKNESKLIFFSSTDGFLYKENKCEDANTHLFTAGFKTEEISNIFSDELLTKPVYQSLIDTFKQVTCDEIGGNIDVFHIINSEVKKKRFKVDDYKTYSDEEILFSLNLVHAERLAGKLILGNKLVIESDLGLFTIDGAVQTIYDANAVKKVELGRYIDPNNASAYKYGLRIYDGAIDIRTSKNANQGIQLDSNGFRAFNNNGVRTFNVNAITGQVEIVGDLTIKSSPSSNRGVVITSSGITGYNASGGITFELNANTGKSTIQENFTIQTNQNHNRGVKMDDYGIRGYNTSGTKTFEIDTNGNATFSGNITGSSITGTTINGGTISGATVNGGNINVTTDVNVGNNLRLGNISSSEFKSISFNYSNLIQSDGSRMNLIASNLDLSVTGSTNINGSNVTIGNGYSNIKLNGTVDARYTNFLNTESLSVGSAVRSTFAEYATSADSATSANSATNSQNVRGLYIAYNATFVYIRDQYGNDVAQLKRSD